MSVNPMSRRELLQFLGRAAIVSSAMPTLSWLTACSSGAKNSLDTKQSSSPGPLLKALSPSSEDRLSLAEGFKSHLLIQWDDVLKQHPSMRFGFNNDFLAFFPIPGTASKEALLCVNHEYPHPLLIHRTADFAKRTKAHVIKEQEACGVSIVKVKWDEKTSQWKYIKNDPLNRKISARTPIPISAPRAIEGAVEAIGTLANCAGGKTPWGTLLTCEENYDQYYGEVDFLKLPRRELTFPKNSFDWYKAFPYPTEHYGWVVEINPFTGQAVKHTSLGRFAHECATVVEAKDGRSVVYTGDDSNDQCLYKFISDVPGSLKSGTLYVANIEKGRWIPLALEKHDVLKKHFKDQTEVLTYCRVAADLVGGSKLDRPEDIEQDPVTKDILVCLTNNKPKQNYFGSILRLSEDNQNPLSLEFSVKTLVTGGTGSGIACPDNMVFDPNGNLWITSDISGAEMNKGTYSPFKNNGLFYLPLSGSEAGKLVQIASAPTDAEFTGPCIAPDGKSLFICVQHPGEETKNLGEYTSHWPQGGKSIPRSAVVNISGPMMDALLKSDSPLSV